MYYSSGNLTSEDSYLADSESRRLTPIYFTVFSFEEALPLVGVFMIEFF